MTPNQQQHEHWNQSEAMHWVQHADRYDRQLQPFADALFDAAGLDERHRIIDVGCGCGATTIAASRVALHATGADISAPMLDVARTRATGVENCEFVLADVQTAELGIAAYDRAISRFGVMFFDDPLVAFRRVRQALRPGGQLSFVSWQPLEANEWLLVPGLAAAEHLELPAVESGSGPGMFSLSDPNRIDELLTGAGFGDVTVEAITPSILLGGGGSLAESLRFLLGTGIARALLEPAAPDARTRAVDAVRDALAALHEPGLGVQLGTGAWIATART